MLRVFFSPDIFSHQRVGGISRYYCELIRRLPAEQCVRYLPAGIHFNRYLRAARLKTGFYIPRLGPLGNFRLEFNHHLFLRSVSRYPSAIIHQTYYSELEYPDSHPLVLTVPDMIDQLFPDLSTSVPTDLKRRNCDRATRLIAISHATKRDLVRLFGISPDKVAVIYLAESLPKVPPEENCQDKHDSYLLYVGQRGHYKNFRRLLEIFAEADFLRQHFRLVAFGGGRFSVDESRVLEELHITDRVHYADGDDAQLARHYRNAAALVYPSLYEGFGLPILEAMGQGCPVICSTSGSLQEVAGEAAAYFDPEDRINMQSVLEGNLSDQAKLAELRERGFTRHKMFSWEKCVEQTLDLYREIAV